MDFFTAAASLGSIEHLDEAAMELLIRVECSGEDFYAALADRIDHDGAAELFRRNGREETGHARRIQRALAIKRGVDAPGTTDDVLRFVVPLPDHISPKLLPAIVQAELDGDAGYQRWADNESDPEVARLLRLNGREETIHGDRVREAIALLESAG